MTNPIVFIARDNFPEFSRRTDFMPLSMYRERPEWFVSLDPDHADGVGEYMPSGNDEEIQLDPELFPEIKPGMCIECDIIPRIKQCFILIWLHEWQRFPNQLEAEIKIAKLGKKSWMLFKIVGDDEAYVSKQAEICYAADAVKTEVSRHYREVQGRNNVWHRKDAH